MVLKVVMDGVFRRRILFWMVTSVGLIPGHFLQTNMYGKAPPPGLASPFMDAPPNPGGKMSISLNVLMKRKPLLIISCLLSFFKLFLFIYFFCIFIRVKSLNPCEQTTLGSAWAKEWPPSPCVLFLGPSLLISQGAVAGSCSMFPIVL